MERQAILLEDQIEVFRAELGHVLDDVDLPGPGRPPVYPAESLFLCWLLLSLTSTLVYPPHRGQTRLRELGQVPNKTRPTTQNNIEKVKGRKTGKQDSGSARITH